MAEAMVDLETRVEQLDARLHVLEQRLARIERSGEPLIQTASHPHVHLEALRHDSAPVAASPADPVESRVDIALVGRSLIGMGGAYLLRALTDSHLVPNGVGLALGLAYALFWIYLADRASARRETHAAGFSAAVGAMIAYPLVCEATAHFHTFSIEFAAFVVLVISSALLAIAWRHKAAPLAWIAALGTIGASGFLALATEQVGAVLVAQALVGALLWHISSELDWPVVRWPSAGATWLLSIALQILVLAHHDGDAPEFAAVVLLIAAFAYLAAVATRNLVMRRNLLWSDVLQAMGTAAIVLTGAARIAASQPRLTIAVTIAVGIVAVASYFSAIRQAASDPRAAYYFGGLAVACTLIATAIPNTATRAGIIWIVLSTVAVLAARWFDAPHFMMHSIVYAAAGAMTTGLLGGAMQTITGLGNRPAIALVPALASGGLALAATMAMAQRQFTTMHWRSARVTLLALTAIVVIAGLDLVALRLTGTDAGSAAAVRSGVIAIAAVTLAFVSRLRLFSDCSVLVYPVLALGAAKFVIDDFIAGRAATLFVTLAVYGFALLTLARMKKPVTARKAATA